MRFQRLATATVTIAALIGLSGCASTSTGPTGSTGPGSGTAPAPSASATPAGDALAEFVTAAKSLEKETMKASMTMPGGLDASGSFDLRGGKAEMTMTMGAEKFAMRLTGKTLYMKYGTEWMSLDVSKLPANSPMNPANMANAELFAVAATDVQRTGDSFKGMIDIAKSPTADARSLKALGGRSTEVPFTAEVDDQGRLIEMTIDMNQLAAGTGEITAKYYDFGTKVTVTAPPAGQVKPMPKELVKILAAQGQTAKA